MILVSDQFSTPSMRVAVSRSAYVGVLLSVMVLLNTSCAGHTNPNVINGIQLPDTKSAAETLSIALPTTTWGGSLLDGGTLLLAIHDPDEKKLQLRHDGSMGVKPFSRELQFTTREVPWTVLEPGGEMDRALLVVLRATRPSKSRAHEKGVIAAMIAILEHRIETQAPIKTAAGHEFRRSIKQ